ncbi:MAG: hypothetical protein Sylvanvirus6_38 [Sylvanvirus sp.]|uniref:Stc1 domain-containing protein n=1 Tax=Sylvanvirus sp. TaxID=2487774 RepID=A0A3G5AHM4_9VIRU|nr:MAG: hypothetical protein Sylvanvirus6_38 [Sylvanvirus sp.]
MLYSKPEIALMNCDMKSSDSKPKLCSSYALISPEYAQVLCSEPAVSFIFATGNCQGCKDCVFFTLLDDGDEDPSLRANRMVLISNAFIEGLKRANELSHINITESYRIEFVPVHLRTPGQPDGLWQIILMLEPLAWFDRQLSIYKTHISSFPKTAEEFQFYENALKYVQHFRSLPRGQKGYRGAPSQTPLNFDSEDISNGMLMCENDVMKSKGLTGCRQFMIPSLVIASFKVLSEDIIADTNTTSKNVDTSAEEDGTTPRFILLPRREIVRTATMFPQPPYHMTNVELVNAPVFWRSVLFVIRWFSKNMETKSAHSPPPVDGIALNFGKWESAPDLEDELSNFTPIECHGHCHFFLTAKFIEECSENFFRPLKGRILDPERYYRTNSDILLRKRLLHTQPINPPNTLAELTNVKNELTTVFDKILSRLDTIEQHLQLRNQLASKNAAEAKTAQENSLICVKCNKSLSLENFSKKQKKSRSTAKCVTCVIQPQRK